MKNNFYKSVLACTVLAVLLVSCTKDELKNEDILNTKPGGIITATLTNNTSTSLRLSNDTFPSYGCSFEERGYGEGETGYFIHLRVSGKKNDMLYFFKVYAPVTEAQLTAMKSNPRQLFTLSGVQAQVDVRKGNAVYYVTSISTGAWVPGSMTISNFGDIGDDVTVNFNFTTSRISGFSNMTGTVKTRYVIYQY